VTHSRPSGHRVGQGQRSRALALETDEDFVRAGEAQIQFEVHRLYPLIFLAYPSR